MNKKKKKPDDDGTERSGSSNRGGKHGHKGTTLNQVKKPDRIKKIMMEQCSCGSRDLWQIKELPGTMKHVKSLMLR